MFVEGTFPSEENWSYKPQNAFRPLHKVGIKLIKVI